MKVQDSTMWGPQTIAKLVNITPVTMVCGTYNELVTGLYKPTYNQGYHIAGIIYYYITWFIDGSGLTPSTRVPSAMRQRCLVCQEPLCTSPCLLLKECWDLVGLDYPENWMVSIEMPNICGAKKKNDLYPFGF